MYRFLLQPRWIALTVFALLAVPSCIALGQWQLHRYHLRHSANEVLHHSLTVAPVPLERLTTPDRDVTAQERWRPVTATGSYDGRHELLVRNRSQYGRPGFYVVTPLVTERGTAVLVNRGWVGLGASATARPDVPAPPPGQVTVTGRIRPSETERSSGLKERSGAPAGQIYVINTERIGGELPYPLARSIVELTGQRPQQAQTGPEFLPVPADANEGMNLSYFVQWNLFAAGAAVAWLVLVWREVHARRRQPEGTPDPTGQEGLASTAPR